MNLPRLDQPAMTIDAGAFVPPPFHVRRINANGDDVQLVAEVRDVADVDGEGCVAAEVPVQEVTIDVDRAVGGDAVEPKRQVLSAIGIFEAKVPAIPGNAAGQVAAVEMVLGIELALDRPVVRQVDDAPI